MLIPPGQEKNTNLPQPQDYAFEHVIDADILKDISYERFVEEYANPGRPAIIRGGLHEMPAARWTPELMVQRWGDKIFSIEGENRKLSDIVAALLASTPENPAPYLRSIDIETDFPEIIPDLAPGVKYAWPNYRLLRALFPGWYFEPGSHCAEFFFGGNGGSFPFMHADFPPMHTFIGLFYGEKEWIGFSPDQAGNLYLQDPGDHQYVCSDVENIFAPDFDRYPKLKNARPVRARQQAGDLMFMPCNWIHSVKNLSPTISIAWDQLSDSCWDEFVDNKFRGTVNQHPAKSRLVNLYLRSLGSFLGLGTAIIQRSGGDSVRGRIV
jgi:hypothetical protein